MKQMKHVQRKIQVTLLAGLGLGLLLWMGFVPTGKSAEARYGRSQAPAQQQPLPTPLPTSTPTVSTAPTMTASIRPAAYKLNKQELETWATFESALQAYYQAINQIVTEASSLPLDPTHSTRIHAALRESRLSFNLSQIGRENFLLKIRAKHKCHECEIRDGELKPAVTTTR